MDFVRKPAPRNRTLSCSDEEKERLLARILSVNANIDEETLAGRVACADFFVAACYLPQAFVDLLILDPPYNLPRNYNGQAFRKMRTDDYQAWFKKIVTMLTPCLKPTASIYVCSDWRTSQLVSPVLQEHFVLRNRITWEREKGRGASMNWKNNTEDIWFCTASDNYHFDVEAVKLKRRVVAPYREGGKGGTPKDWKNEEDGKFRLTHPSNFWSDITIPFWSMPENTAHPTQKPEKLLAKLLLASSRPSDFVFDPFLGSGTSAVVAKKLGRRFAGIEQNPDYCCWALKRLELAEANPSIQGYKNGVFWERNSEPPVQQNAKQETQATFTLETPPPSP